MLQLLHCLYVLIQYLYTPYIRTTGSGHAINISLSHPRCLHMLVLADAVLFVAVAAVSYLSEWDTAAVCSTAAMKSMACARTMKGSQCSCAWTKALQTADQRDCREPNPYRLALHILNILKAQRTPLINSDLIS